jgi:hypothetical protein
MWVSIYSPTTDVIAQSMKCLSANWKTGFKAQQNVEAPNARTFTSTKIIAYRVMTPVVFTEAPYESVVAIYSVEK